MSANPSERFPQSFRISITPAQAIVALIFAIAVSGSRAQSVPVPFAGLLAGGGTVCSGSYSVFNAAGTGAKYGDGCPAAQATLNTPVAAATDSFGNVFIADQSDDLIRVVYNGGKALTAALIAANPQITGFSPQPGNIYTIAGGAASLPASTYCNQAGSGTKGTDSVLDGCPGAETFESPRGIAVDADGNLFISSVAAGSNLHVLYVGGTKAAALITLENPGVTPVAGTVYLLAGSTGAASYTGDNALASKATVNTPRGIFIDSAEDVYFADQLNNVVRRIDSTTGFISTVAGHCVASGTNCTATTTSGDGSPATSTAVNIDTPYGVAMDAKGNLFIAESGTSSLAGRIRVVYAAGTLPGITGPTVGDIYTYAGGTSGTTPAQLATFQEVFGVSIDTSGYLYVTDYRTGSTGSNKLWRVDPGNGNIAAIAGNSGTATLSVGARCNGGTTGPVTTDKYGDGCPATQAYLQNPQESLAFTANGTFYVADRVNNLVRSFTYNNAFPNAAVGASVTQPLAFLYAAGSLPVTEAFTTQSASSADYSDAGGDTCALNTTLAAATTCVDYVKFAPASAGQRPGSVTVSSATAAIATQALNGVGIGPELTIQPASSIALGSGIMPLSISRDANANVNISDGKSKSLLRTTTGGATPTTYIGGLGMPAESTTDGFGNVYVADSANNAIIEKTAAGATVTLGSGLSAPKGVAADLFGNIYVADTGNNRLVYISPITGAQTAISLSGYALSAPTYLALDAAGDLYILDTGNTRLLEIPLGAAPQQVTLPTGVTPAALALDAAGDIYFADTASNSILFLPVGSATTTAIVSGLTAPAGVAVGATGNFLVADSSATSAAAYNVAVDNSTFATTNINQTSLPVTLTLVNVGNTAATLSTPPYAESGTNTSAFVASGTPTCTSALALAPGVNCTQAFVFSPTTPAVTQTAKAVFSDTASQSVTANFTATATNLILTSTTLAPLNASIKYGQTQTYTVTFMPASMGAAAPMGSIAFLIGGKTVSTQNVTSATMYTFTTSPGVGIYSVAVNYSGDGTYASSNASTPLTVNKAQTSLAASYQQTAAGTSLTAMMTPASQGPITFTGNVLFYVDSVLVATVPVGNGTVSTTVLVADGMHTYYASYAGDSNYTGSQSTPQTLTVARAATQTALTITPGSSNGAAVLLLGAKVTSSTTGTPSGMVTFSNGSTMLGTVNLNTAVNGTVTYTTSSTTFSNYSFTAAYSGDGLFDPSTVTVSEGADFAVVAPTTALTVPQGSQAIESLTITPINGYTGTLTATCSNLPVNSICHFQPVPVSITTSASSTLSVQVFVGVNPSIAKLDAPNSGVTGHDLAWRAVLTLIFFPPLCFGWRKRRGLPHRKRFVLSSLLFALGLGVGLTGLSGCGLKTPAAMPGVYSTPVGNTAVTVTVTDANNLARSVVFTVSVNSL
jgi:sugar lactone lactonase YvrE